MTWSQSVDQALCFGWIDGVRRSIDKESYCIRFTPRRSNSIWSDINIKKMETLSKAGLMKPAGLEIFELRTENKSRIYSHEKVPLVLEKKFETQFKKNKLAWEFFNKQSPSYKKRMIHWAGYFGSREGEPIGTGRVISAKALDMINWQLIDKTINSSIDYSICKSLEPVRPNFTKLIHNQKGLKCLSISTYKWENMHKFERELLSPKAALINADEIIKEYFPEMFNLFKE
jgi:hypothetical protein